MEISVTKCKGSLVPPSGPTPTTMLDLSRMDRVPVLRCNARTLHIFEAMGAAKSRIREALSKALVPYYPLAGRLSQLNPLHELQVECSGEGVWFVEASATCSLQSVGYFDDITSIPFSKLLPHHPPENQGLDPLVLMQVTEFEGDGFVMGLTFCHTICDGLGAAQFLNAIGEFARGVQHLKVDPVWQRDFLPQPQLQLQTNHRPSFSQQLAPPQIVLPDYELEQVNIDIPLDHINEMKRKFVGRCSSFEIVAAVLWKNRTQAIGLGCESRMMKLVFFANCRQLVDPPLPQGFYGNCFFPVTISASSDTLAQSPTIEVVRMIQEAKARLPEEFADWALNKERGNKEDPFAPPLGYTTLFISEWGRLGFNQVDYGKGPPLHVVPVQGSSIIPAAIVGSLPRPNKGIRLMTWCVQNHHIQPLLHSITAFIDS